MQIDESPQSALPEGRPTAAGAPSLGPSALVKWLARFKGPLASVAAAGAILSGLAGYWNTYRTVNTSLAGSSGAKRPAFNALSPSAGPLSIVVLPFGNVTGDPSQEYVADGLTESITSDLSRINSAFVVGASTAQVYKGKSLTAQQVGTELGVRFVLRGTVQRNATKLRVNAQLVDTTDNAQLWTQTFDGDATDLLALEDQVTTLIGNSMGEELVVRAAKVSETRQGNATVADLLLRIRALSLRPQSTANWKTVQEHCRQVLAIEPSNVDAMGLLALSLAVDTGNFGSGRPVIERDKALDESTVLSDKVAASLPDDLRTLLTRALIAYARRELPAMLRNAQRMVELYPRSTNAHLLLGLYYYNAVEPEQSLQAYLKSFALFPSQPQDSLLIDLCKTEFMLRHYDEAVRWCVMFRDRNPGRATLFPDLAMAYAKVGNTAAAHETVTAMLKAQPMSSVSYFARKVADFQLNEHSYEPYRAWYAKEAVPAMRLAGIPE